MSKKKEYWKKRFTDLQDREQLQVDKYRTKLDKKYKKVIADIERDIQVFYMRYAQAEGIDYATARRDLSKVDMRKWEVSLSEYRKMALSGDFENELESMYAKSRISRLEALKTQIRANVEVLHKGIKEDTGKLLSNTFSDTYYRSIYELQKGTGIGINFATYNQDAVNILISQPFKGGNYSTRIWNSETSDRGKLVRELQDTLTSAFIRGDSAAKTIGEMTKRLNTSAYNIARVVQTETAYISGQASALAYKSQGVERYEFLVSLDEITCPKCRPLDGKDFGLDEKIEFINYPPIHPWCRCTTIPYYEDYDYGDVDTRIARAADGTVYKVPDMPYEKWHDKYVEGDGQVDNTLDKEDLLKDTPEPKAPTDPATILGDKIKALDVTNYSSRRTLAKDILTTLDIDHIPIRVKSIKPNGYCSFARQGSAARIQDYVLNSADQRGDNYKIKTAFHEAYHAKGDGLDTDYFNMKDNWIMVEETFAETSAHYLVGASGIAEEIAPAYAEKLIEMLPRMKQLDKFKNCETFKDFGRIAWNDRLNRVSMEWKDLYGECMSIKHDWKEYAKQYVPYIADNKEELVDVMLKNMPGFTTYRSSMIDACTKALDKISNGGYIGGNEGIVIRNILAISMNRLGVK